MNLAIARLSAWPLPPWTCPHRPRKRESQGFRLSKNLSGDLLLLTSLLLPPPRPCHALSLLGATMLRRMLPQPPRPRQRQQPPWCQRHPLCPPLRLHLGQSCLTNGTYRRLCPRGLCRLEALTKAICHPAGPTKRLDHLRCHQVPRLLTLVLRLITITTTTTTYITIIIRRMCRTCITTTMHTQMRPHGPHRSLMLMTCAKVRHPLVACPPVDMRIPLTMHTMFTTPTYTPTRMRIHTTTTTTIIITTITTQFLGLRNQSWMRLRRVPRRLRHMRPMRRRALRLWRMDRLRRR